jgi:hypothetical protein
MEASVGEIVIVVLIFVGFIYVINRDRKKRTSTGTGTGSTGGNPKHDDTTNPNDTLDKEVN